MRAAAADDDLADGGGAEAAGLAFAGVDAVLELEEASYAFGVDVVRDGGAAELDGALEDLDERDAESLELGAGDAGGLAAGTDAGAGEGFVGVDIADAVEQGLVEEGGLNGRSAAAEERGEVGGRDDEGFGAGAGVGLAMDGEAAEAAGIDEADLAAVGEGEDGVGVWRQRDVGLRDEKAAGHAEVNEELGWGGLVAGCVSAWVFVAAQGHDDGLADATDLGDGGAGENLLDLALRALEGLGFAAGPDAGDALALDAGVNAVGDGFDLRQLGQWARPPQHLCRRHVDTDAAAYGADHSK